jgi:hypothetical protein
MRCLSSFDASQDTEVTKSRMDFPNNHIGDIEFAGSLINTRSRDKELLLWLQAGFRLLAVGMGGLHAWVAATQQSMSEDGISYLDMGDAYLRGDWNMAINTVWSPLYSWILGVGMKVIQPTMQWEIAVVHLINFAIYLFALISFEFFWRELSPARRTKASEDDDSSAAQFPEWAWLSVGYALFVWSSLSLIKIWAVTPDMLMAGCVYLAAGLLYRIAKGRPGWITFFVFGFVLGLAYLAKSVMFPLAFVFLAVALFVGGEIRHAAPRTVAALLVFLLIAAPFVTLFSVAKGRLTFGDAGRLTYLKLVNGIPYPHWRSGASPDVGTPHHPARQIFENPAVFEFATPVGGTYPLSYDPSYWYEGVVAPLDIKKQVAVLVTNAGFYFDLFIRQQGGVSAIVGLLLLLGVKKRSLQSWLSGELGLVLIAIAAFGLYALVYLEGRYIGAFLVLFWAGLLSFVRLPDSLLSRKLLSIAAVMLIAVFLINIAAFNLQGVKKVKNSTSPFAERAATETTSYRPSELAEAVLQIGIKPGDRIAFIGYSFGAFFARLARLQIIAEIPETDIERFWYAGPAKQTAVIESLRSTGVKAIIAERLLPGASAIGWRRIGGSTYLLYPFP